MFSLIPVIEAVYEGKLRRKSHAGLGDKSSFNRKIHPEITIAGISADVKRLFDERPREHRLRLAIGEIVPLPQKEDPVAKVGGQPQIMQYDQDRLAAASQIIEYEQLVLDVQMIGGLVQNDGIHPLGQRTGQEYHLSLAS